MYMSFILITGGDEIPLYSLKKGSIEKCKLKENIYCFIIVLQSCMWLNINFWYEKYESIVMSVIILHREVGCWEVPQGKSTYSFSQREDTSS
jgi:hypothetical protein